MLKIDSFFLLVFTVILGGRVASGATPQNLDLATAKVVSMTGEVVPLRTLLKGDYILLDFWASWCSPCKDSLPYYGELQNRYSKRGLQVLAISVDEDIKKASAFAKEQEIKIDLSWDPEKKLAKEVFKVEAIPSSFLINKEGKILFHHRGFKKSDKTKFEEQLLREMK